jgi:hypothetical protein
MKDNKVQNKVKICGKRTKTGREQKDGKREESGRQKTNTIQNIYKKEKEQQTKRQKEMAWVMLNPRKCAKKTEYREKHKRDV